MVLKDSLASKPPTSIVKRTALYVLSFGLGALFLASVLGFTAMSIADAVLPKPTATSKKSGGADAKAKAKIKAKQKL